MSPIKIESGILDKTKLFSNFLLVILVAGNIFFSIQYTESIKQQAEVKQDNTTDKINTSRFLKEFIDVVLNTKGEISYDDRVSLEANVRKIGDPTITSQWDAFVSSADATTAQQQAVKLMQMLTNKLVV